MAQTNQTSSLKKYQGNCHCGAFKFSVQLAPLKEVVACNCSICTKKGYLWADPPSPDLLIVEKGDGQLRDYEFGKKSKSHKFCPICGTPIMLKGHKGSPFLGINVRTLEGFDEKAMKIVPYDAASREPAYEPPTWPQPSDQKQSTDIYNGSCHCGKVMYQLQSKSLQEIELTSCNCSICSRNGYIWHYPHKDTVEIRGEEHLTLYRFGSKLAAHAFCSTCGVPMFNFFSYAQAEGPVRDMMFDKIPVNIRTVNGIDLVSLKIKMGDMKSHGKPYEV